MPDIEDSVDVNGKLLNQHPSYDKILQLGVSLQLGEGIKVVRVTRRAIGSDGSISGSMINEVKLPYGQVK